MIWTQTHLSIPRTPLLPAHTYITSQNQPLESLTTILHCSTSFLPCLCSFDFICLECLPSPFHLAKAFLFLEIQVESLPSRKPFLTTLPSPPRKGRSLFSMFPQPVPDITFITLHNNCYLLTVFLRGQSLPLGEKQLVFSL